MGPGIRSTCLQIGRTVAGGRSRCPKLDSDAAIMSLHCHKVVAKTRSIAVNVLQAVRTSVVQEDIAIPYRCGAPVIWTAVCRFVKPPNSQTEWLIREHGASEIDRDVLGLLSKDPRSHCETWIHLSHVSTPIIQREREQHATWRKKTQELPFSLLCFQVPSRHPMFFTPKQNLRSCGVVPNRFEVLTQRHWSVTRCAMNRAMACARKAFARGRQAAMEWAAKALEQGTVMAHRSKLAAGRSAQRHSARTHPP